LLLTVLAVVSAGTRPAFAQPQQPPGSQPGAEASRFEAEVQRQKKRVEQKKPKPPEIEVPEEKPAPEEGQISFTLKEVIITGSTLFKPEDLKPLYEEYVGKKVSSRDLSEITERIKAKYKQAGYPITIVYMPEQDIRGGRIEIRVVEGKIGELKIEGNRFFNTSLIEKYIHIKKNEIINLKKLERDILRLLKNPDLDISTVISPGKEPGTADLILKVKDRFPYHAGGTYENQGTRLTGKDRGMVTYRSTNLTGNNDSLFGAVLFAKYSDAQSVGYTLPIDTYGTRLGFNFSRFYLKLGKEFREFDITGDSQVYSPFFAKELWLSETSEVDMIVGIDIKSIKKYTTGVKTADDQLRVPYFGYEITRNDAYGQTVLSPRFSFGTGRFLGASKKDHLTASRPHTGGFFFKYEQTLTRVQKMPFGSYAVGRCQFQVTPQTLSPSEQLQLGGANSIRGYPEGDFLADTGVILNFDWIFPMYCIPESVKLPYSEVPLRRQIEPVFFVDMGGGRINKAAPGEKRDKFLAGIGGGIRVRLYRNVFCRFEWAKDIGAHPTSGAGPSSFHVIVQTEI